MSGNKHKKETRIDILKAQAMGAYIRASGDINETYKLLKKKIPKRDLKKWEKEHRWPLWFEQHQNELLRDVFEDETKRKKKNLALLRDSKEMIVTAIRGTYDKNGDVIVPPVRARSLESCVECMIQIIETERSIHGDKDGRRRDDGLSLFSYLLDEVRNGKDNAQKQDDQQLEVETDGPGDIQQNQRDLASH